ncbi:membrin-12-like isoform X6 [Rutidosis leptorrhynchoides]|uniref:membrin-12-like isoform X6 n=1 Tax=Rutidosis leptorrhynchoides TaxID=125765 RepID=UPI003A9913E6
MDGLWRSVASKPQRDLWKRKVEQVVEEADSLRESLDRYMQRQQRRMQEAQERAELLGRAHKQWSLHVTLPVCWKRLLQLEQPFLLNTLNKGRA